ncbi:MAG: hypothetical protein LBR61_08260 [Synergistaceae bacterium]|nr:hypothetical protein [Synergistaceae bacterium]
MKKEYAPIPENIEEAAQLAASVWDEDIDFSDIPEFGGLPISAWKSGSERKHDFGRKHLDITVLEVK